MFEKLNIEDIARELDLPGGILTFRPFGKKAKDMIIARIDKMMPGSVIEMDFRNIFSSDVSFADEMITNVQLYLREKDNMLLFITNITQEIKETLEASLSVREVKSKVKVQILYKDEKKYGIIGSLEQNQLETFELLNQKAELTARDVAEKFELEINSASNRLKKLYDQRLVLRKEQVDSTGRQHIYYLPQ